MLKLMDKKIFTILRSRILFNEPLSIHREVQLGKISRIWTEFSSKGCWEGFPHNLSSKFTFPKTMPTLTLCPLVLSANNSLDADQAQQNVGPDLDPNCLTL